MTPGRSRILGNAGGMPAFCRARVAQAPARETFSPDCCCPGQRAALAWGDTEVDVREAADPFTASLITGTTRLTRFQCRNVWTREAGITDNADSWQFGIWTRAADPILRLSLRAL